MKSTAWMVLMVVALGAQASEEDSTPCDNVDTDQQAAACATFNQQTAERELKATYDDLIQRLRDQYPGEANKVADVSARLAAAQKLWTQLRDADCKVETYTEKPGSAASPTAWNTCIAQHSDERSEYLRSLGPQSDEEPAPED